MEYHFLVIDSVLFKGINLVVKDADETILGGIVGSNTEESNLYIEHLWIDEAHRKQGLGSRLLAAFEDVAQKKHFNNIFVDTFEFQAPLFYEKNNYQLYEIRHNNVAGYNRFYYSKSLYK